MPAYHQSTSVFVTLSVIVATSMINGEVWGCLGNLFYLTGSMFANVHMQVTMAKAVATRVPHTEHSNIARVLHQR